MKAKIITSLSSILIIVVVSVSGFGDTKVKIICSKDKKTQISTVFLEQMKRFPSVIKAVDPNFKKDGQVEFTGITIKKLLSLVSVSCDQVITLSRSDQYVGFVPGKVIRKGAGLLSWKINGQPISLIKGGPLKIVYPDDEKAHGSCIHGMLIPSGRLENPFLKVEYHSDSKTIYFRELILKANPFDSKNLSIPSGCRNGLKQSVTKVQSILLSPFLEGLHAGHKDKKIRFIPFAGPEIMMSSDDLKYPIHIVLGKGKSSLWRRTVFCYLSG
jgi:hypothetical protein